MKFAHLKENYHQQLADLPELESKLGNDHPRLSWYRAVAEETIASFYMANDDDRYREHLSAGLNDLFDWWQRGHEMGAWDFILYSCVGLALEEIESVERMLEMEVSEDGYARITVEWFRLQRAILMKEHYSPTPVKKTKGEERIFVELTKMCNKIEPDWSGFDAYWKSTRNRTHELTILQHRNLLKDGMNVLWRFRNNTKQGSGGNGYRRATLWR